MRAVSVSALLTLAALAGGSMLVAQPAVALEPGVHIDPHSPAAKEYALPVNQARAANGAGEGSEDSSETLFGAGIKPPSSGSSGGAHGRAGPSGRQPARSSAAPAGAAPTSPPPLVQRVADARASSGGGSSATVLLAGGVAILVLGAFGGIVLRHSRRPDTAA